MSQSKVVLLSCGSYNPPTNMHLRMFEIARDAINRQGRYHVIGGIISPVHDNYGKKELISATHRCALVNLALQDSDWIHLSDWECNQEGWLPTRQILQYHQNKINSYLNSNNEIPGTKRTSNTETQQWILQAHKFCQNNMGVRVKLLCGADLLESFDTPGLWKDCDIESIVGDHGLAVVTRSGNNPLKFIYESDVLTKYQNNICIITEWIVNEVSSTKIRRALRRGESVKYLLDNQVIDYIKNNGLYSVLDNKYDGSSIMLTPSPNDVIMSTIDVPDTGNYYKQNNRLGIPSTAQTSTPEAVIKRARPGLAVPHRKVTTASSSTSSSSSSSSTATATTTSTTGCCPSSSNTGSCSLGPPLYTQSFDENLEEEEVDDIGECCNGVKLPTLPVTVPPQTNETRVEIQISEDGQIQVISDKETTV